MLIAVSGGSDSLALLLSFHAWQQTNAPHLKLVAVTIDHALRAESAEEATYVAGLCAHLGVRHKTIRWNDASKGAGLSARARDARYALLLQVADETESDLVLVGHTLDDQFETHLMRKYRSNTGYGLSGMAPAMLYRERLWIGRPLLDVSRLELRSYLQKSGRSWIDDPSNEDNAYERVRVRRMVAGLDEPDRLDLQSEILKAQQHRVALVNGAAELIARKTERIEPDGVRFSVLPDAESIHALRVLLAVVGGTAFLPDAARVSALAQRIADGEQFTQTLARCVADARNGVVVLRRECRNLPHMLLSDQPSLWDGRFIVSSRCATRLHVSANETCQPRVRDEQGIEAADECFSVRSVAAPFFERLSSFDWPLAGAVFRLLGNDVPPALPWHERNNAIVLT